MKSGITRRLGEIADVQQGYTFKPGYQGQSAGEWIYAKVADIGSPSSSKYLRKSLNYVSSEVLREMRATPFPAGSIVFPRVGAALRNNNKRILAEDSLTDDNVLVVTVRDKDICDPEYLYYWFDFHDLQDFCNSGTVPVINGRNLKLQDVPLPNIQIQRKTAGILSVWDDAIEKCKRLSEAKEQHYIHELSRLISRAHHPHSHIGAFARELSERNRQGNERVLSVTNSRGFVLPEEQFERRVASTDLSNYKVVRRGQYAYNPSRINVGSIARLDGWDDGVLSPMYVVFEIDETKAESDYFVHWLDSHEARQRIKNSAQGSVRETVSFGDFAAIHFPLPERQRQTSIAAYLSCLRNEIGLLERQTNQLRLQKRGLMQKLLTGEWRVPVAEEAVA
ncbi:restriction endonuclease subunit S [Pseudomonas aeruginosa]|uniref:restriction endonuclease subunit S n=1 Tax=Pseudomonas aeruginosa TaxID=287 RepID=UPI000BB69EE2|nr:restriction endonuclease subunit S [Pseudomonas aeruginosa]EKY1809566.1 restriction endonuclease subunit S [Pseudomonas aeruginosa]MBI6969220.1 restriction endonuclease subunit S [Pseudomonas aeruginosa]MBV5917946.1 restriction endonuclease subunit S [Pseudomonas aeruginosa]MBX6224674.1 restriction endonuclease subunit S [Pseudomonas aeruginosa]MCO2995735.1 restriction endonuclease subunit S [Pseudomonas aeruginosa]